MKKDLDMHIQEISISDKEINKIVDIGIIKKEGFFKYLFRMIKTLGLKNIFYDKAEVIVILIALFLFNSLIFNRNIQDIDSIYVYIFILTPISYLVISFFSYFNAKQKNTFDIEMICKHDVYQILAIRMFLFSIISILLNSSLSIFIYIKNNELSLVRANIISITALFLFSSIFLYSIIKLRRNYTKYFILIGWIIGNVICSSNYKSYYMLMLKEVPIYVHIIVSAICIFIYISSLKRLIKLKRNKGEI